MRRVECHAEVGVLRNRESRSWQSEGHCLGRMAIRTAADGVDSHVWRVMTNRAAPHVAPRGFGCCRRGTAADPVAVTSATIRGRVFAGEDYADLRVFDRTEGGVAEIAGGMAT
jgi:hypothetical protein